MLHNSNNNNDNKNGNVIEDLINENRRLKNHIKSETKSNMAVVIKHHAIDTSALNKG